MTDKIEELQKALDRQTAKLTELDEAVFDYELDDVKEDLDIIKKYLLDTDPKFTKMYKEKMIALRKPVPSEDED